MDLTLSELQKRLDTAHFRLHCKVIDISELSEIVTSFTAKELMEIFIKAVTSEDEDITNQLLCKLLAAMWVFHDLGMIKFEKRTDGLAITLQEMILNNQKKLAARLIPILEHITEYLSEETISIIK
ncbi:MAG: hypothetical protein WED07_14350 [Candidatus Freyarchaeum deiterrae]